MVIVSEDSKGRDLLLFLERDPRVIVSREGSQGRDVISMYLSITRFLRCHFHIFINHKRNEGAVQEQSRSCLGTKIHIPYIIHLER